MHIGDTQTGGSETGGGKNGASGRSSKSGTGGRPVSKHLAVLGVVAALVLLAGCLGALTGAVNPSITHLRTATCSST